jgi:divalent metal cation (Fe/Co/Zn/Cd) transporter
MMALFRSWPLPFLVFGGFMLLLPWILKYLAVAVGVFILSVVGFLVYELLK